MHAHTRIMYRSAGGWSQTWALQMGGPARGALGSQGGNAQPCRGPLGARRTREEELENEGRGRKKVMVGGWGKRIPRAMVEGGNGGISKGLEGERRWRASRQRRPYQGEPLTLYRLDYTKRSNLGPGVGSRLRAIAGAGKPTDRAGPERAPRRTGRGARARPEWALRARHGPSEPVCHEPSSAKVDHRSSADAGGLFVRNPYPALHRSKIKQFIA